MMMQFGNGSDRGWLLSPPSGIPLRWGPFALFSLLVWQHNGKEATA